MSDENDLFQSSYLTEENPGNDLPKVTQVERNPELKPKEPMMNTEETDQDFSVFLYLVFHFFLSFYYLFILQPRENAVRRFHGVINYAGTFNECSYDLASLP